ncbi:non-ribosomal peptide synthetase [Oerskovia turbata]
MTTEHDAPHRARATATTAERAAAGGGTAETVRGARSVPHAFDTVADAWPNRTAIEWDAGRWTYRDLQTASRRVERQLRSAGVSPGAAVALLGDRAAETCATMLGLLRLGAAYVPIDASLPAARVRAMLDTAGVGLAVRPPGSRAPAPDGVVVLDLVGDLAEPPDDGAPDVGLTGVASAHVRRDGAAAADGGDVAAHGAHSAPLPSSAHSSQNAHAGPDLDLTACVMFTSGSTGTPKAVAVRQRGVLRLATDNGFLVLDPANRFMHAASLSFDSSILEIWPTLLSGACLVIVDQSLLLAPAALRDAIRAAAIDSIFLTTGVFHHVARTCPEVFDGLRYAIAGGEVLNPVLAARAVGRAATVVNGYGPTETTVLATAHVLSEADAGRPVPIGAPLPYVSVAVLRPDGSMVRPGEDGELHIAGDGLAAGYLGDPAETARRFVPLSLDGAPPARHYRTGDQVRWGEDGLLEFRGRLDDQIKVRGHRVEVTEIEGALAAVEGIGEAAVVAVDDDTSRVLVAYCTPARPGAPIPDPAAVRRALAATLPTAMLPATITPVDALPFTSNGKVDRRALADRARTTTTASPPVADETSPPRDAGEAVARAWRETLALDVVDPGGDFFALGGNSLGAAQLIARVQSSLSLDGTHGHDLIRGLLSDPRPAAFTAVVAEIAARPAGSASSDGVDRWRPDVRLLARPAPVARAPRSDPPVDVLLTGATGFFGSALLRELVDRTAGTVHCLVRAADRDAALARVLAAQQKYGHGPLATDRVVAVPGDLTAHRLGLDDPTWEALAARTDLIYHSGAHVNFVYPYEWLRRTNVDGTRSLVELAEAGGGVPLHYVSTIAVLAGSGSAAVRHVSEDAPLDHVERLSMGYPESKWVAEQVLRAASARGLPVVIHRPYEITGRTVDGHWNTEAAICSFFKAIVEMGRAPDVDLPLDFVPVDHLARAVAHLAQTRPAQGQTYHLTNPRYALLGLMVERLRAHGHPIDVVDYDSWLHDLSEFCAAHPEHPIVSFLPIFTNIASSSTLTVKELYFEGTFPRFGREHTDEDLAGSGIECPPVDAEMLDAYVRWFHAVGYIDRPRVGAR